MSSLQILGLIETDDRHQIGQVVCRQYRTREPVYAIVPKKYTHLRVDSLDDGVALGWEAAFGLSTDLPELLDKASGPGSAVLRYNGPAAEAVLDVPKAGNVNVRLFTLKGSDPKHLEHSATPYRGPLRIPGPGLVQIDTRSPWTLTLR